MRIRHITKTLLGTDEQEYLINSFLEELVSDEEIISSYIFGYISRSFIFANKLTNF